MLGIYFSGTGNSRYVLEVFLKELDADAKSFAIEDKNAAEQIKLHDEIVFAYPVQYSAVPKIVRDFIEKTAQLWKGKRVFVIATMAAFSGDGSGVLARLLKKHGAVITGGLHLAMPDSIADEKVFKRPFEKNKANVENSVRKAQQAARDIKGGRYKKQGLGLMSRFVGFISQRLWFGHRTMKYYSKGLKIDSAKCVGCGKCAAVCPTGNISVQDKIAVSGKKCTVCYRCVNSCPMKAITLLGDKVEQQTMIEKYI